MVAYSAGMYPLKVNNRNIEQDVKYVRKLQQIHQDDAIGVGLVSFLLTLNLFHPLL